jgi:hypothetical protein
MPGRASSSQTVQSTAQKTAEARGPSGKTIPTVEQALLCSSHRHVDCAGKRVRIYYIKRLCFLPRGTKQPETKKCSHWLIVTLPRGTKQPETKKHSHWLIVTLHQCQNMSEYSTYFLQLL